MTCRAWGQANRTCEIQHRKPVLQVLVRPHGAKEAPMDLLVMENIFYEGQLAPIYDLKGSERARLAREDPHDPACVLLDQNLLNSNVHSPLLVSVP